MKIKQNRDGQQFQPKVSFISTADSVLIIFNELLKRGSDLYFYI